MGYKEGLEIYMIALFAALFLMPQSNLMAAPSPTDAPSVPFQKVIEAAGQALEDGDYDRLQKLEPYLRPQFEVFERTYGRDLNPLFQNALSQRAPQAVMNILIKITHEDIKAQLNFPDNADPEILRSRVQLAYLDYLYIISKQVADVNFSADGYIKNSFRRAFQTPLTEWADRILSKLSEIYPKETGSKEK